jgi:hypothetical protein
MPAASGFSKGMQMGRVQSSMDHIEEQKIELYVLDAAEVRSQAAAIREHLAACPGCRAIEERLRAVYVIAADEFSMMPEREEGHLPVRRGVRTAVESAGQEWGGERRPVVVSLGARLRSYVARHPIGAAGGAVASLAAAVALFALVLAPLMKKPDAAFAHCNIEQDRIEVFSKDRTMLWSLPAAGLRLWQEENQGYGTSRTEVADLRGDGEHMLVTTAPLAGEAARPAKLKVCAGPASTVVEREIGGPVEFRGVKYSEQMDAWPVAIVPAAGGKGSDVIVAASAGRSPTVIARVNAEGSVVGEYWHFGALHGLYTMDLDGNGTMEIIASGTSDIADVPGNPGASWPVLVVLDASRLTGRQESRETPGFGFEASVAERAYVRFPRSDMDDALGASCGVLSVRWTPDSLLIVKVLSSVASGTHVLDFGLSWGLTPRWVRLTDAASTLHQRLKAEGKVRSVLDPAYLEGLRGRVEVRGAASPRQ